MNREIKFRAWAKKTVDHYISDPINIAFKEFERIEPRNNQSDEWDKWYKDREDRICELRNEMRRDAEDRYEITYEMITDFSVKADGGYIRPYRYEILDVMQYTGLHDKKGKEIYEGDIVIHKGKYHDVIGQITFGKASMFTPDGGHQGFYTKWLNDGSNRWEDWWRNDLNYWIDKIEIIGNIHTNPELLKEVSDEA